MADRTDLDDYVARKLAEAPPLTREQLDTLHDLLHPPSLGSTGTQAQEGRSLAV